MSSPSQITSHVVFERIPVAAFLLEVDGWVIAANRAAARMLALPDAQIAGRPLGDLFASDSDLRRMLDATPHVGQLVHELHFGDPRRTAECVVSVIEADGRPVYQLFAIDITARKQAESAARARAERDEQSAAKQRLESLGLIAGGVAHDFNNLLVGVLAESSAAREDANLSEPTRDALRRIEAAAQRMAHLTRQMLAYAGRGRVVTQRIDPDELLRESADALARLVRTGVTLSLAPSSVPAVIDADPGLLRQVVTNLVANAAEARAQRVEASSRIVLHNNESWWQVQVADDGAGMTPQTLGKIFEPFFSTSPERHGLGLSAVHGIVRRLGGDIVVESSPGKGAKFSVRLPIVAGAQHPPRSRALQATSPPPAKLAGLRVLIVDDEPSVRATVRRLLERRGATVEAAVDGAEAEDRLRSGSYDLVISDVVMPGKSGYDVLSTARKLHPRCPIILMSGYTDRSRGEGAEDEPDAFLEKPFTARVLDDAIDEVMRT